MADGALCLPSCPLRLPLLFPKSSSILFGSPVCARQVPQGEAMYSRSVFGTAHRSIQDSSARSLGRDDKGGVNILQYIQNFTFYILHLPFIMRSFVASLLRMTGETSSVASLLRITERESPLFRHFVTPSPQGEGKKKEQAPTAQRRPLHHRAAPRPIAPHTAAVPSTNERMTPSAPGLSNAAARSCGEAILPAFSA